MCVVELCLGGVWSEVGCVFIKLQSYKGMAKFNVIVNNSFVVGSDDGCYVVIMLEY